MTESIQTRHAPDLMFEKFDNTPFDATTMALSLILDVCCCTDPAPSYCMM
jgi:hypothetical protein